jgi:hypothetical protein
MTQPAQRHDLTAVMLVDDEFDIEECAAAPCKLTAATWFWCPTRMTRRA